MATKTPNYGWDIPTDGGDDDVWGGFLNGNWSDLDGRLKFIDDRTGQNTTDIATNTSAIAAIKLEMNPVGTVIMNKNNVNPATYLGGGTWVLTAVNKVIKGADTGDTGGELEGSNTHTLTEAQLPPHDHTVDPPSTSLAINSAAPSLTLAKQGTRSTSASQNNLYVQLQGNAQNLETLTINGSNHSHSGSVNIGAFNSGNAGSGQAFSIEQESMKIFVWERTA